jgi:hypothetical protein
LYLQNTLPDLTEVLNPLAAVPALLTTTVPQVAIVVSPIKEQIFILGSYVRGALLAVPVRLGPDLDLTFQRENFIPKNWSKSDLIRNTCELVQIPSKRVF